MELPVGLYGSELANALATIDQTYNRDCLIVADLSNDATYGETLFDTFGRRVLAYRLVAPAMAGRVSSGASDMALYQSITLVGPSCSNSCSPRCEDDRVRFANSEESIRAYEQLAALEPEQRESGTVYKCPSGQHDDLAMSLAMLAWAAQHLHLECWTRPIF